MKAIKTFWNIVADDQTNIIIPMLQRDYAQGRKDPKATQIRETFIHDLFKTIFNYKIKTKNNLVLDFIYGYKDTQSNLILLDGQQRMTTLWLLHWFIACNGSSSIETEGVKENFLRFQYKTRYSAEEFCKALIEKTLLPVDANEKISEIIKDQSWFFTRWTRDPTVNAMLNTLDTIEEVYKFFIKKTPEFSLQAAWNNLISEKVISFNFMDMGEYDLGDELYIKMNARGKPLEDFENFKAWLIEKSEDKTYTYENHADWKMKFDKAWLDFFWKLPEDSSVEKKEKSPVIKTYKYFFRYLKRMGLAGYFLSTDPSKNLANTEKNLLSSFLKDEYIPFGVFEAYLLCDKSIFERAFDVLDLLTNGKLQADILNILNYRFNKFLNSTEILPQALFVAVSLGIIKMHNNENALLKIKRWERLAYNLLENQLYSDIDDYRQAVQKLSKLLNKISEGSDLYGSLVIQESIPFFSQEQSKEEILKAFLITKGWGEETFVKYEQKKYFKGKLQLLLNISKSDEVGSIEWDGNKYSQEIFNKYSELFCNIFDAVVDNKNFEWASYNHFQACLLTYVDYLVKSGSKNKTFCLPSFGSYRARNENWNGCFKEVVNCKWIKQMLDDISETHNADTNEAIKKVLQNKAGIITDWRQLIIDNPALIKKCGSGNVRFRKSNGQIYLLRNVGMSGYNYELHTRHPYEILKKYFNENSKTISYIQAKGIPDKMKHSSAIKIPINLKNDKFLILKIRYWDKSYYFEIPTNNENQSSISKEIIDKIEKSGFIEKERLFSKEIVRSENLPKLNYSIMVVEETMKFVSLFEISI